jgi:hypothetical protein
MYCMPTCISSQSSSLDTTDFPGGELPLVAVLEHVILTFRRALQQVDKLCVNKTAYSVLQANRPEVHFLRLWSDATVCSPRVRMVIC